MSPKNVEPQSAAQWQQWHDQLRADATLAAALVTLFEDLTAAIAARGPTCWTSGKCCNFNAYGHRLYVTGLEITWLLQQLPKLHENAHPAKLTGDSATPTSEISDQKTGIPLPTLPVSGKLTDAAPEPIRNQKLEIRNLSPEHIDLAGPCVFQQNNLCTVHAIRPLGCRAFFCQQGTQDWQHELYENFQQRLRELHEQRHIPYRYVEWRFGLQEALTVLGS